MSRSADISSGESTNLDKTENGRSSTNRSQTDLAASVVQGAEQPGLPRLNYNLKEHKTTLIIVTFLLVAESSLLPIALFYGLWFHTTLRHGITFAIITSFFGLITGLEFALRSWKLTFRTETYQPIGGTKWWHFDFTHYTLITGYTVMTGILIGASIPHEPLVRPLAIPVSLFLIQLGVQLLVTGWMHHAGRPAPFRVSSVPKGERMPPLVFTIVEDIVGVDGGAGQSYRRRLVARNAVSARFRLMIAQLNWFWGVGALLAGVGTMVVIWTVPQAVAYGVGWGAPLVFVIIWTIITVVYTRHCLRKEKQAWGITHTSSALDPAALEALDIARHGGDSRRQSERRSRSQARRSMTADHRREKQVERDPGPAAVATPR